MSVLSSQRTWADEQTLLEHAKIQKALDRLSGLTTDVRNLYKPFVS